MAERSANPPPAQPLQDRVAIITGASRGIGRGIAVHLASLGAKVVINYTSDSAKADGVTTQINRTSTNSAVAFRADISDPAQVKSLFDFAESSFNAPVHILVNSAGIINSNYPNVADTTTEDFDAVFNINTRGAFLVCREAANRIRRGGGGRIVCLTTSVVASLKPGYAAYAASLKPGYAAYAASKASVETMVKILAKELKGTGITANCVAPGPVSTDMFFSGNRTDAEEKAISACPLGRMGTVDDVAPVVGFLSGDSGEWVNGQVIRVNGGYV